MASTKDTQISEADDKIKMLKEALKCVSGTLDFDKLATKMNVANAEAMRKRFKRFFEKDEVPIQIKGSTLGSTEEGATILKTPRTPKPKAKSTTSGDDDIATPKNKAASSKRKAVEILQDDEGTNKAVAEKKTTTKDTTPVSDNDAASESPKKKARKSPAKPRKSAKSPQTPKTTKPPGTPKTPKTPPISKPPSTPNALLSSYKLKGNVAESGDEGVVESVTDKNDNVNYVKEGEDAKTDSVMIGSPAISAKTDILIKATKERNGGAMGEPAQQVKRDAVESAMKEGAEI